MIASHGRYMKYFPITYAMLILTRQFRLDWIYFTVPFFHKLQDWNLLSPNVREIEDHEKFKQTPGKEFPKTKQTILSWAHENQYNSFQNKNGV